MSFSPAKIALYVYPAFFVLMALEAWYVVRLQRRAYVWREALSSLAIAVGNRFTSPTTTPFIVAPLFGFVWEARLFTVPLDSWWAWALLFVAVEFVYYWFHRWSHEVRWFWATHSVHHSPQQLNLTAAYRLGWTGLLSGAFLVWTPLVLLGFHPAAVFGVLGLNLVYQFWLHTETIRRLPRWFEAVFNTPSHHRVHHAVNPGYLDRNYGGVMILFDRWFGTFAAERDAEPCRYGLVRQVGSLNPLRVVFHEWAGILRDLRRAQSMREVWGFCFGAPGWRPDGPGDTAAEIRARAGLDRPGPGLAQPAE